MVLLKVGDTYVDYDYDLLVEHLNLLDSRIREINEGIDASPDPDGEGLCDRGEYFIGSGFVAIQRYLTSARSGSGLSLKEAFEVPPMVNSATTFVEAINAAANYWKHVEEWFEAILFKQNESLKGNALATLKRLEKVTPWEDYTCSNVLAVLTLEENFELSSLLPSIAEWRKNLMQITK